MVEDFVCNLCGSSNAKVIPFRYSFKERYIDAVKCSMCNLISLHPQPTAIEIEEMYREEYFTEADKETHHGTQDYLSLTENVDYTEKINFVKQYVKSGTILEVGCATGTLLKQLQETGFIVKGIEISKFAADFATKNLGIDVINKAFDNSLLGNELQENSVDAILMGDVLEHFTNPKEAMELSLKILKKGGVLIVTVPCTLNLPSTRIAFLFYRLLGSQKTMTIPPYHLTEFFPKTLKKMFVESGFSKAIIKQRTKHPKTITLRHSKVENLIKLSTQYPNYYLTKLFGIYGDRMTGIGIK